MEDNDRTQKQTRHDLRFWQLTNNTFAVHSTVTSGFIDPVTTGLPLYSRVFTHRFASVCRLKRLNSTFVLSSNRVVEEWMSSHICSQTLWIQKKKKMMMNKSQRSACWGTVESASLRLSWRMWVICVEDLEWVALTHNTHLETLVIAVFVNSLRSSSLWWVKAPGRKSCRSPRSSISDSFCPSFLIIMLQSRTAPSLTCSTTETLVLETLFILHKDFLEVINPASVWVNTTSVCLFIVPFITSLQMVISTRR